MSKKNIGTKEKINSQICYSSNTDDFDTRNNRPLIF